MPREVDAMDPLAVSLSALLRAAQRGARSITRNRQIIEDAVVVALQRWEQKLVRGLSVGDLGAWAYCVGANAARDLTRKAATARVICSDRAVDEPIREPAPDAALAMQRGQLRVQARRRQHVLVGRQFEVVMMLCRPGVSLHMAARALKMDRANLRRSFRAALRRLAASR